MKHLLVQNLLQARHSEKEDMISSMDNLQVIDYVSLVLMLNLMYIRLYDRKFNCIYAAIFLCTAYTGEAGLLLC